MKIPPIINLIVGICGLVWLAWHFGQRGFAGINLDVVNFAFLMVGVLLHWTPTSFLKASQEGGSFIWGVAVQFPFYAGNFRDHPVLGLAEVMAGWFTAIATKETYPFIVVWYSGDPQLHCPFGWVQVGDRGSLYHAGRQEPWASAMPMTVIAYAWGDMVTDVIQPFWAIPLLGVAKLSFRDIMGYCMVYFLFYMVIISIAFLLLPVFFSVS